MSTQRKMIDLGTGASLPWSSTCEMASSPINFDRSMDITSDDNFTIVYH